MTEQTNAYKASMEALNIRSEQHKKEMDIPARVKRILDTAEGVEAVKQSLCWVGAAN